MASRIDWCDPCPLCFPGWAYGSSVHRPPVYPINRFSFGDGMLPRFPCQRGIRLSRFDRQVCPMAQLSCVHLCRAICHCPHSSWEGGLSVDRPWAPAFRPSAFLPYRKMVCSPHLIGWLFIPALGQDRPFFLRPSQHNAKHNDHGHCQQAQSPQHPRP